MHFFKIYKFLKESIIKQKARYFKTTLQKAEYIFLLLLYITLTIILQNNFISDGMKGVFTQVEALEATYLAFRFTYLGAITVSLFALPQSAIVLSMYLKSNNDNLLAAFIVNLFIVAFSIFVAILSCRQEEQRNKLHNLSITDELTGIYNLRFFHTALDNEIESAKKNKSSVGLIMIDIDDFKMFNDIYGHDCGDEILHETANLLKKILDEEGYLCRYGGDEFAVILPKTDRHTIVKNANLIKREVNRNNPIKTKYNVFKNITLSIGASEYPYTATCKDELLSQADMALYHAKNLGKDRVHFYQSIIQNLHKNISSNHQQLIGAFKGLLSTISAKDKYTLGHCERVATYAVMIGEAMNLSLNEITTLQYAGLLHDIGKIEIPKTILSKLGPLKPDEFEYIKMHPVYSANILEPLEDMNHLVRHVRHHHERFDGTGYPDHLAGEEISLGARILCIADSFDAMLSERPYSKSMSLNDSVAELERCSGTQFDPKIVKIFVSIIKEKFITQQEELIEK